ncbi:MAG: undecaprenyl-phosphate glucose phosphotransferase [Chloroflexi bacterium]|nr:undecaprenyl-phosphate glucose phosphotransferase [Chloroflexota bacterium]
MRRHMQSFLLLLLVALDGAFICVAFYLAYRLRRITEVPPAINILPFSDYAGMMVIQLASMWVAFFFARLYHRKHGVSRLDETSTVAGAVSIGTIVTTAMVALIYKNDLDYPRLMVIYAWGLTIVFVALGRWFYNGLMALLFEHKICDARTIIVGTGEIGRTILRRIEENPRLGYGVIGFVDGRVPHGRIHNLPILGTTGDLHRIIDDHHVDAVIIGLQSVTNDEILDIISRCRRGQVSIKVFPDFFQIMASEVTIDDLGGMPLLSVRDPALHGWKLILKRSVDILVSGLILILTSPLMLLIALLIRMDSPGPVFYVQERMGLDAKPFPMLKFRSMRIDAEAQSGPVWAQEDDPRRTHLGALLRRLSLDELPQFINVLLGDMSIVGPRPERPVFVDEFRKRIPRYMDRHWEKTGITGWAQVNGLRGDTSIEERTKYDLYYVENWSIWFDFKIMLLTVIQLFRGENAY